MSTIQLNIGAMIAAIENRYKPKKYTSNLQALMDSHLWHFVDIHLNKDTKFRLENACGFEPRDLTTQEKLYLEESDEEEYHDDGYDKWDEIYNDLDDY